MKIQSFFILILLVITLCETWKQWFPSSRSVQNNCIIGQTMLASGWVKVIDCSICISFSRDSYQKGSIQISNGLLYVPSQKQKQNNYELYVDTYIQKECIEYQCTDFINKNSFQNSLMMEEDGLKLVQKIVKNTSTIWDFTLPYDNYISHHEGERSFLISLFNRVLGSILPQYILPARRYYNSMVIKLRYSQPEVDKDHIVQKPFVKMTRNQQNLADFNLISILILFTIAIKIKVFMSDFNKSYLNLLLGFTFISPPLFSLISFMLLSKKNIGCLISTLIYLVGLVYDQEFIMFVSIVLCSLIDIITDKNVISFQNLTFFNLIIFFGLLSGVDSLVLCSPSLFWALYFQENDVVYSKIGISNDQILNERIIQEAQGLSG